MNIIVEAFCITNILPRLDKTAFESYNYYKKRRRVTTMKFGRDLTIAAIIKSLLMICLGFIAFVIGFALILLVTYGALEWAETGADLVGAVDKLVENSDWEIIQIFGERIFGNIPFADLMNAVFITHVNPNLASLFPDLVTATLAGLLFYLIARLNLILSRVIKSRLLFGAIISLMTVVSICISMVVMAWITSHVDPSLLIWIQCGVFLISLLLHTLFLFFSLRGIKFLRVLLSLLIDSISGICNNVFLWFCSYIFMYLLRSSDLPSETVLIYSLLGIFFLYGIYSIIMDKITSFFWHVAK
jgi:hypothetical protein